MKDADLAAAANEALADLFEGVEGTYEPVVIEDIGPATPALTVDANDRTHGPDGKFVKVEGAEAEIVTAGEGREAEQTDDSPAAESEPTQEEIEEAAAELAVELDPDHPFFAKYDGDLDKAFKALEESQSFIGKQSQELGELRREMREQMEAMQESMAFQQQAAAVDWEGMIEENPELAAIQAVQYRNPAALDRAMEVWYETEPYKATSFMQRLQAYAQEAYQEEAAPATSIGDEIGALKTRLPDIEKHLPAIQQLAGERPMLAQALAYGEPRDRAQALEDLYHLAKSRSTETDTSAAARRVILKAKQEADKARADAAVVGASNTSVAEAGPSEDEILQQTLRDLTGLNDFVIV